MAERAQWIRFIDDLPDCCVSDRLRLPRPFAAHVEASSRSDQDALWQMGLNAWCVRLGVTWSDDEHDLAAALQDHAGTRIQNSSQLTEMLADHGVHLDDDGCAWVGQQDLVVGSIGNELAAASGRSIIWNGLDLWEAADAEAGDLEKLVAPLIASDNDDDDLWCQEIMETWSAAFVTHAVILLRAVDITPAIRGYRLGAWAAAQSIALFDQGSSLVATQAAPIDRRDAVPGLGDTRRELTSEESTLWTAEQDRLARHWRTQLGLVPLSSDPTILTWHTSHTNETIKGTLKQWAI